MNKDVIEKIKSLLNLAESDNIHEAAAATAAAMSLMAKHRISEAMLGNDDEDMDEVCMDSSGRMPSWKMVLSLDVADANGVFAYTHRMHRTSHIQIVGRESDVQATLYLYSYCVRAIDSLALRAGAGRGRKWCTDYRHGCVSAVADKLKTIPEKEASIAKAEVQRQGTSLVVLNSALAKISARKGDAKSWFGRPTVTNHINAGRVNSARDQGLHDGKSIDVSNKRSRLGKGTLALGVESDG